MSMMVPLLPKLANSLGASRSLAGLIGELLVIAIERGDGRKRERARWISHIGNCLYPCNIYSIGSLYGAIQIFSSPVVVSIHAANIIALNACMIFNYWDKVVITA